jgi:hypothetical protein
VVAAEPDLDFAFAAVSQRRQHFARPLVAALCTR